ncbi:MAG: TIGR01777 family protein [Planctomycetota bacterium]|nr:MAG: TIGR01777 family protein [Planctomycetota bacterium]
MTVFERRLDLPVSPEEAFAWHERDGAFERLAPPWESIRLLEKEGGIQVGDRLVLRHRVGWLPVTWEAVHTAYQPGRLFRDEQKRGPFSSWIHSHGFEPGPGGQCQLYDRVEYRLPFHGLASKVAGSLVDKKLRRLFAYRHRITLQDLLDHKQHGCRNMKIAISGASGLVGSSLEPFLSTAGHEVKALVRPGSSREGIPWDPARSELDLAALEGMDAVVHLAGENIAAGRWSDRQKKRILDSRVQGTRVLAEGLASLQNPPKVLVCASAVGFYGDTGETVVDESQSSGEGFLPQVCQAWEEAAEPAKRAGIRVVHLRFGVILSPSGGALKRMLPPFRFGLGGRLGSGNQWMSWISLEDASASVLHAIADQELHGAVNVVAPDPIRNRDFTKVLGKVLRRPTAFPLPAFVVRTLFGEMGQDLLLAGSGIRPSKLLAGGFRYRHPELEGALRSMLGR